MVEGTFLLIFALTLVFIHYKSFIYDFSSQMISFKIASFIKYAVLSYAIEVVSTLSYQSQYQQGYTKILELHQVTFYEISSSSFSVNYVT